MRFRVLKYLLLLALIVIASCTKKEEKTGSPTDYIPEDASLIFKISDWKSFSSDIENNGFLKSYLSDLPFSYFSTYKTVFENLHPTQEIILCFNDPNPSFTFISPYSEKILALDSIQNKTDELLKIDNQEIHRITLGKEVVFSTVAQGNYLLSSSQQQLMDLLNRKTQRSPEFSKLIALDAKTPYTVVSKNKENSSWTNADLKLTQESLSYRGISVHSDSIPNLLSVFQEQQPQVNRAAEIVPKNAHQFMSITFNDSEKLQNNLQQFRKDTQSVPRTGILDSAAEAGYLSSPEEKAYFLVSIDPSVTNDALAQFVSSEAVYKEVEIKNFTNSELIGNAFNPLLPKFPVHYVFEINDFFVFTPSIATAEEIISAAINNATVKHSSAYEQMSEKISSAASINQVVLNGRYPNKFQNFFNHTSLGTEVAESAEYPLGIFQYISDQNFGHISFHTQRLQENARKTSDGVRELFHTNLKAPVLGNPQIFEYNGPQVVVQDIENTLYFISESGNILWTRNLGKPILGDIQFVDLNQNGNKQLAFATANSLFLIDRNGKDISGFPVKLKDAITQPLAIFDYDNNHQYRFVVVQNKNVLLYDNKGKLVKGFNFKRTASPIVQLPKHIRMGNKDYLLVPEESGKLHILDRQGRNRVNVKKTFNFSEIPIVAEDHFFVVIDKDHNKQRISETGEVSTLNLNVSDNYWFTSLNNTKATLDDNLLRVDGKLLDLPLGVYSRPIIFAKSGKQYIGITELQEKKVYLFGSGHHLLPNFPLYGNSVPALAFKNNGNEKFLVVKSDEDGVIVYSFQ